MVSLRHPAKLACMLLTLLALAFSACGGGIGISKTVTVPPAPMTNEAPKAPYDQQIMRFPFPDAATFDPALTTDIYSTFAIRMIFATLVQIDSNLQLQPYMAQSWSESPDGLTWTFHLQPDLTFSDGTPLTSQDVAYSLDRALQPATNSPNAATFLGLIQDADALRAGQVKTIIGDSILTPDPSTLVLKLTKRAAYFLFTLTMPAASIVEKKLIDKYGNAQFTMHLTEGGGSGPFIFSQRIPNKEMDFVPNPYYYGLKPQLQKFVIMTDDTRDTYRDYQDNLIEETFVPSNDIAAEQKTTEYHAVPNLNTSYLTMNFLAKPFDNLHIRQAFALAINREKINNDLYDGLEIPTYHIIPQGMAGYNLDLTGPAGVKDSRGNIGVARQLLQVGLREEGWSDVSKMPPIKFSYAQGGDALFNEIAQMWQSALGVKVQPDPYDFNTFLQKIYATRGNPHGLQLWTLGWSANYPDPYDWITTHFGKGATENTMNYGENSTADALQEQTIQDQMSQADAETDPSARLLLYQSIEQQLINQVAWIPLYQRVRTVVLKSYVKGLTLNALWTIPPIAWSNIYIAAHS